MTDRELYEYSRLVGGKAREWKKKFVALLPEIARRGIHRKHGFATIVEFAAKVGGVGKKTVEAVFQVSKKIEDKPALKEVLPKVGVHKVRLIATLATKENQEDLAKKVVEMSKPALELFARSQREVDVHRKTLEIGTPPGRKREFLGFHVDKEVALELKKFKQKLGTVEWNDVMKAFLDAVKEEPKKTRKSKKTKITRTPSVQEKRKAYEKENGKCTFPDCNNPATELHHPDRFSLKSSHKRMVALCKTHHELAHHGLIENEENDLTTWRIKERADEKDPKFKIDQKVIEHKMAACITPI